MTAMWAAWVGVAVALTEPSDFRREVHSSVAAQVAALRDDGRTDEALSTARRFCKEVEPAGLVVYEEALTLRLSGAIDAAFETYTRAIALDPGLGGAHYDRGEIELLRGNLDAAQRDFEEAARLVPEHWVVHFRLADLAARRGDAESFELHLTRALIHGFSFRDLVYDPVWKGYARDPALGPVLGKLITVYSDESLFDALRAAP